MAGVLDRIRVIFDLETANFNRGLSGVRADVAAADGLFNKAKVGAKGLGDQLSQYAAPAAMAAGAALVTFGTKSVKAFTDTALAAGDFADATAVSVEDASRWIALGDDFGISADTIQGALAKVNKASDGVFEKYGIDVVRAADGTRDANATFLAALDAVGKMPDVQQRAKAATELFGRSYTDVARLIEMGAKDIQSALDDVSGQQIIDEDELRKARDYQAAMDQLSDTLRDLMIDMGETLTPTITSIAEMVDGINNLRQSLGSLGEGSLPTVQKSLDALVGTLKGLGQTTIGKATGEFEGLTFNVEAMRDAFDETHPPAEQIAEDLKDAADRAEYYASRVESAGEESSEAAKSIDIAAESAAGIRDAADEAAQKVSDLYDEMRGDIDVEQALADLEQGFIDIQIAGAEAYQAAADGSYEAGEKAKEYQDKQRDLKLEVLDYAEELGNIPPEVVSDILADIDEGKLAEAKAKLDSLEETRHVPVWVSIQNPTAMDELNFLDKSAAIGGGRGLMDRFTRWGATVIKGKGTSILSNSLWDQVFGILGVGSGGGSGGGSDDGGKPGKPGKPTMPKPPDDPDKRKGVSDSEAAKIRKDVDKASRMYERGKLTADEYLAVLKDAAKSFKPLSDFGMWLYREIQRVRQDIKDAADKPDRKPKPEPRDPWEVAAAKQERGEARDALKAAGIDLYTAMTDDDTSNDRAAQERWADAIYADIVARANVKHRPQTRQWASFVRGLLEKNIEKNSDLPHTVRKLRLYLRGIPEFDDTPSGESNTGGDGGRDMRSALAAAAAADPALKARIAAAIKAKSAGNGGAPTGQVKVLVASDDRQLAQWMGNQISKLNAEQG